MSQPISKTSDNAAYDLKELAAQHLYPNRWKKVKELLAKAKHHWKIGAQLYDEANAVFKQANRLGGSRSFMHHRAEGQRLWNEGYENRLQGTQFMNMVHNLWKEALDGRLEKDDG